MTPKEQSSLLMLCGALQDVSEKCKDKVAASHVKEVQLKIEAIVIKNNKDFKI